MGRHEDAEKALCWLRGWTTPDVVRAELKEIDAAVKASAWSGSSEEGVHGGLMETFKMGVHKFTDKTFLKPFTLITMCFFLGNFTGVASLSTFAVSIFASLGSPIDKYYATCMLGIAQMLGSIFCASVIHTTGKRPLVMLSTLGQSILFASVAFYAYYYAGVSTLDNGAAIAANFADSPNKLSWVPLVGLIGGALCAYSGARLLPWIIIGEIFPADIRALASGMAATMFYLFAFGANKTYFAFVDSLTVPGVYWLHSSIAAAAAIFYYFFLPETEGWTLLEVQEHFEGKRNLIKAGKKKIREDVEGVDNLGMTETETNAKV